MPRIRAPKNVREQQRGEASQLGVPYDEYLAIVRAGAQRAGSSDPVQPEEWNTAIDLAQSVDDGFMVGGDPRGQDIMQSDGGGGAQHHAEAEHAYGFEQGSGDQHGDGTQQGFGYQQCDGYETRPTIRFDPGYQSLHRARAKAGTPPWHLPEVDLAATRREQATTPPWHLPEEDDNSLDFQREIPRYGRWPGRREHVRTVATPSSKASSRRIDFIRRAQADRAYGRY